MSEPFDLSAALETVCREALREAAAALDPENNIDLDAGVATARKRLKRVRAVLRLVRGATPEDWFRAENMSLRDTGRLLAELRDASVAVQTLAHLHEQAEGTRRDSSWSPAAERRLSERYASARRSMTPVVVREVRSRLLESVSRLEGLPGSHTALTGFDLIEKGLRTSYRKGKRRLARSTASCSTEDLHEWRKVVKHLRYQLEVISPERSVLFADLIRDLDELGELLGIDHDIAVTVDSIRDLAETAGRRADLDAVADRQRGELQRRAFEIGNAFYRDAASVFTARVRNVWYSAPR